jgi:hypothetical protein
VTFAEGCRLRRTPAEAAYSGVCRKEMMSATSGPSRSICTTAHLRR